MRPLAATGLDFPNEKIPIARETSHVVGYAVTVDLFAGGREALKRVKTHKGSTGPRAVRTGVLVANRFLPAPP